MSPKVILYGKNHEKKEIQMLLGNKLKICVGVEIISTLVGMHTVTQLSKDDVERSKQNPFICLH